MPSPLVFFQIASSDPERSKAFLEALFDWRFTEPGDSAPPSIDPQGPGDFDVKGAFYRLPEGASPSVTLSFRVSDLWATVERAESLGARILVPIRQNEAGTHFALIRTPDGLALGIVQA